MLPSLIVDHGAVLGLVILALMLLAFTRESIPPSGVGVIGAAAFVALGIVDQEGLLAAFANPAAVAIGAMLVLSAALVRTGTLEALAGRVLSLAKTRPRTAVVAVLGVAAVASAFVNSTPIVVILIPLMVSLAAAVGTGPKKLLIPLSYIAILGGSCTLIGTSTNLLVDSIAREGGLPGFGIFDITGVGLIAATVGCLFLALTGRFLLPASVETGTERGERAVIVTELRIADDFEEIGTPWAQAAFVSHRGVRVVQISRAGDKLDPRSDAVRIEAKDRVVLRVTAAELATLVETPGLDVGLRVRSPTDGELRLARVTVAAESDIVGRRVAEAPFLSRFPVALIGVRRRRNLAGPDLARLVVRPGDRLWVRALSEDVAGVAADPYLIVTSVPRVKPFLRRRASIAVATLAAVIAVASLGLAPLAPAAVVAVGFLLLVRSLDTADAWGALNIDVLVLIYSMLVVGTGLQNAGSVDLVVRLVRPLLESLPLLGVIAVVYALTSVLTEAVTNNAVAVIMTPLVIQLAASLGIDPTALIVTVMFAASSSFATPVGYQTNTLVHVAGNYRFAEFLKIGVPMNLVVGAVTCVAIAGQFG